MLLLSVTALTLGSCTEEYEYSGAKAEGEQVYFSNALPSTVELSATESSITVPVNRINRQGELTVPLTVSVPDGSSLTVSSQVTFNDGDSVAYVSISYDPTTIEYGHYDEITVAIQDANYTTPYGSSSYTFNAGLSEWVTMSGTATYRDGIFSSSYEGFEPMAYSVQIQENVLTPGMYRIVNPYGPTTEWGKTYLAQDGEEGFTSTGEDAYIEFDATDPEHVYVVGLFDLGVSSPTEGAITAISQAYFEIWQNGANVEDLEQSNPEYFGTFEDGVITLPASSMLIMFENDPNGQTGSLYYGDSNGMTALALPGYSIRDYSASFTYTGRYNEADNTSYALGTITLGADVANARYAVAADGDDLDAYVTGIEDGSIEANVINASGNITIPLEESGYYTIIILTYDADGERQGIFMTEFAFRGQTSNAIWEPLYVGNMFYGQYPIYSNVPVFYGSEMNGPAVIYQNASLPSEYKLEPYAESEDGLIFRVKPDNTITFDTETGSTATIIIDENGTMADFDIYAQDFDSYFGQEAGLSFFGNNMFVFGSVYYTEIGYVAASQEIFQITGPATASSVNAITTQPAMSKQKNKTYKIKRKLNKQLRKSLVRILK